MPFISVIKVGTEDWLKGVYDHIAEDQTSVGSVLLFSLTRGGSSVRTSKNIFRLAVYYHKYRQSIRYMATTVFIPSGQNVPTGPASYGSVNTLVAQSGQLYLSPSLPIVNSRPDVLLFFHPSNRVHHI